MEQFATQQIQYVNYYDNVKVPAPEDSKFSPLDAFFFLLDLH